MTNAFGIEHISKASMEEAHIAGEHKTPVAACPKCGPGSQRAKMSMRAWETRIAAAKRVVKSADTVSAFGVDHGISKGVPAPKGLPKLGGAVADSVKGLRGGMKGNSFGAAPGSTAGMLGAKTGNTIRAGVLKPSFKPAAIGAGAGLAAGGAMGMASSNKRKF